MGTKQMTISGLAPLPNSIICEQCGGIATRRGNVQKYCLPCSEERNRASARRWARANPLTQEATIRNGRQRIRKVKERGILASKTNSSAMTANWPPLDRAAWYCRLSIPYSRAVSKNHIWALTKKGSKGTIFNRQESANYRGDITLMVRSAMRAFPLKTNKVWIDIFVQKPDHKSDAVNTVDLICDAIKDAIGVDDRWFCISRVDWEICKKDPYIMIGIFQERGAEESQVCSTCGAIKPYAGFPKHTHNKKGISRVCMSCSNGSIR